MMARARWQIKTLHVLDGVFRHRIEQVAQYGLQRRKTSDSDPDGPLLADGTGPDVEWLGDGRTARHIEEDLRAQYDARGRTGRLPSWMELLREEVAEAFCESDPKRLRDELEQVAALAVAWIEDIETRS